MKKLEEEKTKLLQIERKITVCTDDYRAACKGIILPEKIKELKTYLSHLENRKNKQKAEVKREKQNVDKIREKLVEIMKERKILENLKEKDFQNYKKLEEVKEQQRVDELVSYKKAAKMDRTG